MELTIKQRLHVAKTLLIVDKIEDTFGPNPCQSLVLHHEDGTSFGSTCDGKRCIHCGPRKKATIQYQMQEGLGEYVYIQRFDTRTDLDTAIERIKKRASRTGQPATYQSVGDPTLGWLLASRTPIQLDPGEHRKRLSDWMDRILDLYHHSVQRIRRSYALGRVSLVTLRRKGKSGQPSMWRRRTFNSEAVRAVEDLDWDTMLAETEYYEGVLLEHRPNPDLPIPF